jgi:hypothetical protein
MNGRGESYCVVNGGLVFLFEARARVFSMLVQLLGEVGCGMMRDEV